MMVNENIPLLTASKAAGHHNVRVTEEVYARLQNDPVKEAVNLIGDKIASITRNPCEL